MSFGLSVDGLAIQDIDTVKARVEADFHDAFGADSDVTPESIDGQLIAILSEMYVELWEGIQAVYAGFDPSQNSGDAQDAIAQITGTIREAATPSTVIVTACSNNDADNVPSGSQFSIPSAGTLFESTTSIDTQLHIAYSTLAGGAAVVAGDRYYTEPSVGVYNTFQAEVSGVIDTPPETPVGTGTGIVDGTVTWEFVGIGRCTAEVACESVETGPQQGLARTITQIETPITGILSAMNLLDATLGTNEETDAELRIRREDELRTAGNATVDSIRVHVLTVSGVTMCRVLENTTDVTDGNGLPAHSVCVVVLGGATDDIAAAVFTKAAGIATYGNTSTTVVDEAGDSHTVSFYRPTEVPIYIINHVSYDVAAWPEDGADQIALAQVTFGDRSVTGKDAVSRALGAQGFAIPGVLNIQPCYIGTAPAPASETTITISPLQIATYDTSRISCVATPGTP